MGRREQTLVEDRAAHKNIQTARNLPDAANSGQSIQGYAAVNGLDDHDEVARVAYQMFEQRGSDPGDADGDWFRAEAEIRRKR